MSTYLAVWAWIGLALGLVVLALVAWLLHNVVRPLREIERYAGHVLDAGVGIARNLDGVDEAVRTRDLATAVPPLAVAYLGRVAERGR